MDNKLIAPVGFNKWSGQGPIKDEDLPLVAIGSERVVFGDEPVLCSMFG
jgi:hypothetical protein